MPDFGGDIDLAGLSAATPEKVAWEYPAATDVVELYGERVAAGSSYTQSFVEEFTGTLTAYTNRGKSDAVWSNVGGGLEQATNNDKPNLLGRGPFASKMRVAMRGSDNYPTGLRGNGIGLYFDSTHAIVAGITSTGTLQIAKVVGDLAAGTAVITDLVTPQTGSDLADPNYYRLTRDGLTYTLERFTGDVITTPGLTPDRTLSVTLAGADATDFAGNSQGCAYNKGAEQNGTNFSDFTYYDRLAVEVAGSEQRNLVAAVTSPGAVRTARRLLGYDGSILRSGIPVEPETFTTATLPDPALVPPGRLIYVSDAAAGTQWRISDGIQWLTLAQLASPTFTGTPAAPTQGVANNSTALATTAYADRAAAAHIGRVAHTLTTSLLNTIQTALTWDTESEDTDTMVNLASTVNLTGTVATTNASATLTGTGTAFTTELLVGHDIIVNAQTKKVTAIASATSLTVDSNYSSTASALTAARKLNDRITAKTAGLFLPQLSVFWPGNATGYRELFAYTGSGNSGAIGTLINQEDRPPPGATNFWTNAVFQPVRLAINDFVRFDVWQNSTATLTLGANTRKATLTRLGT